MVLSFICQCHCPASSHTRIGRAHFYPGSQAGNLIIRKLLSFGRHLQIGIGVSNSLDQQALLRVTRHNRRSGFTAFEHTLAGIEQQSAFDFFGLRAVAFVAIVSQHRANAVLEKCSF